MICPICDSEKFVKNGIQYGRQKYKCKSCGYQSTREESRHSHKDIAMAVSLYSVGLSFRTIAQMFEVSPNTIYLWVKNFAEVHYQKPSPKGVIEVELDEMWHFVESKKTNCGYGKHTIEQINNFLTGNAGKGQVKLSKDC
jgi:transposase-like protein